MTSWCNCFLFPSLHLHSTISFRQSFLNILVRLTVLASSFLPFAFPLRLKDTLKKSCRYNSTCHYVQYSVTKVHLISFVCWYPVWSDYGIIVQVLFQLIQSLLFHFRSFDFFYPDVFSEKKNKKIKEELLKNPNPAKIVPGYQIFNSSKDAEVDISSCWMPILHIYRVDVNSPTS